jgi:hypothetical protein
MMASRRAGLVLLVALSAVAAVAAGAVGWTSARRPGPRAAGTAAAASKGVLHVPRVAAPIPINAEIEGKKDWEGERGNTPNFIDAAGKGMVPYTEARLRWGGDKLYLLLYAGDLDLEGTVIQHDGPVERDDSFRLAFQSGSKVRVIDVSLLGTVADRLCAGSAAEDRCDPSWESHAEVAVDRDGTMNKIGDNDEEWVVEMAIPFASLGIAAAAPGTRLPFGVSRCEVGHGPRSCGGWGNGTPPGEIELDP